NYARNTITNGSWDYPSFDGNGAQLIFVVVSGNAQAQLVGTGSAQTQLSSSNPNTAPTYVYASGVTTIAGPISTPP
ncbi:MAG: hypothetical protein L0H70_01130, partial [Xanthomonadales bacterium]|nr:hypothetical protein [Xanthomonadales bacterium]